MTNKIIPFLLLILFISCTFPETTVVFRTDFSAKEKEILDMSRKVIEDCYFTSFVSIDTKGQPRVRVMEPFAPEADFTIWMATNPKSRKVNQIKANPKTSLHYFDKSKMSYVSLMGNAYIINDSVIKAKKWKKGWERFYPNQTDGYMLIKFVPNTLELINIPKGFTGDSITWKPHQVLLRKPKNP